MAQPKEASTYLQELADINARLTEAERSNNVTGRIVKNCPLGIIVYKLTERGNPESLTIDFMNTAASMITGAQLDGFIGMRILEAFPGLQGTELPHKFAKVVETRIGMKMDAYKYSGDERTRSGNFMVYAFPTENDTVSVIFDRGED